MDWSTEFSWDLLKFINPRTVKKGKQPTHTITLPFPSKVNLFWMPKKELICCVVACQQKKSELLKGILNRVAAIS